jgi:hypothetical protein
LGPIASALDITTPWATPITDNKHKRKRKVDWDVLWSRTENEFKKCHYSTSG